MRSRSYGKSFFFSSRRRHTRCGRDWSSDVCSSDLSLNALKTMRPIESKGVGNWRNHLPRIKQQISLHGDISKSLIKFDYETDTNWLQLLDDVDIEKFNTKTQEFYDKKSLFSKRKTSYLATLKILIEKTGIEANKVLKPFS